MGKDGPPSGRIGHGFRQAEAGAPFTGPRSTARINLDQLLKRRPVLRAEAERLLASGDRADTVLESLRFAGRDGRFAVELYRGPDGDTWVRTDYADTPDRLVEDVEWGFRQRVYSIAKLWVLEAEAPEGDEVWRVLRSWPEHLE